MISKILELDSLKNKIDCIRDKLNRVKKYIVARDLTMLLVAILVSTLLIVSSMMTLVIVVEK